MKSKTENIKIKPFKNFWVCISEKGEVQLHTLSYSKKQSIKDFIDFFSSEQDWDFLRKEYGWKCIKVNVIIEPVKK